MASETTEQDEDRPRGVGLWILAFLVALLAVGAIGVTVWRGWTPEDPLAVAEREAEEKKKQDEEKEKLIDPKVERVIMQPGEEEQPQVFKPGHWMTATQRMKAIYEDFLGESQVGADKGAGTPYPVDGTPFVLRTTRPVALAKGKPKDIELTLLVPQENKAISVATELRDRSFVAPISQSVAVTPMPAYQYHFLVLAREPNRYSFVKSIDSVKVPFDGETEADDSDDSLQYRVVAPIIEREIPVSDNPLTWTSIAFVLWDEIDPKALTPEQQRAIVDWLHWGGQLIVSGPDSLDLLQGSFLEPLLPATGGGSRKFEANDPALAELNKGWLVPAPNGSAGGQLKPTVAWSGVKLDVQPGGAPIYSTGGLLVERPVGRGRIVVSAMQLSERDLVNWKRGFESWFNACVLRRPNRQYKKGMFGALTLAWADPSFGPERRLDARLTTRLRYLARDLGVKTNYDFVESGESASTSVFVPATGQMESVKQYRAPDRVGGIGAWNDFSDTANTARESLIEAAGVEVPGTGFVVGCLALYLIALVPLNWMVFHALGRIEWAWVAAPIIAIAGTVVIVDRARLDIGFVRAHTEIGLLELQPDYPRGILDRYTALYSSLSTTFDFEFDNLTTVAAPFPTGKLSSGALAGRPASSLTCDYQRYDKSRLNGVFVPSNSTNMVHSEQMLSLDGAIRLGESSVRKGRQIENGSQFDLQSVAVVSTDAERKQLKGVWIGSLRAGESASLSENLPTVRATEKKAPFFEDRAAEERLLSTRRLNVEPTFALALDPEHFEPGETWLVARIDDVLPGETITPAASQVRGATLVVAHLKYADLPRPTRDVNTRQDVPKD